MGIRRIHWPISGEPKFEVVRWHSVQIISAAHGDPKWLSIHAYLDGDEPKGVFATRTLGIEGQHVTRFMFSDENTAFEFKMRFG